MSVSYSDVSKKRAKEDKMPLVKIEIDKRHLGEGRIQISGVADNRMAKHLQKCIDEILHT